MDKVSEEKSGRRLFGDVLQRKRYVYALLMVFLMVLAAELLGEKEVIFPELTALTVGMWIVGKRVWRVKRWHILLMMTVGATAGVCLVRYVPFPLWVNLSLAFFFASFCLMLFRATLIPLFSACMLPVLLGTESWVYPIAVFVLVLFLILGQIGMERAAIRQPVVYTPSARCWKKETGRWLAIWAVMLPFIAFSVYTENVYCFVPPLVVTYVEFSNSRSGFRNRPFQIVGLLVAAALIGSCFQWVGHVYFRLPECVVVLFIVASLFFMFEGVGKFFAPVGAVGLIPLIIPYQSLKWFPLQVAVGSAFFIVAAMLVFQQCYKWPKSHLMVCWLPEFVRNRVRKH